MNNQIRHEIRELLDFFRKDTYRETSARQIPSWKNYLIRLTTSY